MFKSPFSFKGRIRRTEFGLSLILYYILELVSIYIMELNDALYYVGLFMFIPLLWFSFAQGAKRCHDRGNSGWFQLIPFYVLWMLFADSEHGDNRYGENPKGIGNRNEIDEIGKEVLGE